MSPLSMFLLFNHYFYKKLSLYIHIPNIYFGLGFEFGPQRIWDLAMFVVRAHNHNYNRFGRPIESQYLRHENIGELLYYERLREFSTDYSDEVSFYIKHHRQNGDCYCWYHGLRTPNEGINQRYLKNWADVADKICFGRT